MTRCTDDGWTRMWDIFQAALDCERDARGAFVAQACGADQALRRVHGAGAGR